MWRWLQRIRRELVSLDTEPGMTVADEKIPASPEPANGERCDRCGGKPIAVWEKDATALWLCSGHSSLHGQALRSAGYVARRLLGV